MKKMNVTKRDYNRITTRNFNVVGVDSFFTAKDYSDKDNIILL